MTFSVFKGRNFTLHPTPACQKKVDKLAQTRIAEDVSYKNKILSRRHLLMIHISR
jgi:hypothetical protein